MPKMVCRCGYVFDRTPSPEPFMWVSIKDTDYEKLIDVEAEAHRLAKEYEQNQGRVAELDLTANDMQTYLYNCPVCNRIFWYRGARGEFKVFTPETDWTPPDNK